MGTPMIPHSRYLLTITNDLGGNVLIMSKKEEYIFFNENASFYYFIEIPTSLIKMFSKSMIYSYEYKGTITMNSNPPNQLTLDKPPPPPNTSDVTFKHIDNDNERQKMIVSIKDSTDPSRSTFKDDSIDTIKANINEQVSYGYKSEFTPYGGKVTTKTKAESKKHYDIAREYVYLLFLTKNKTFNDPFENLIIQQWQNCPMALDDLTTNKKKTKHWAWWVFPTEQSGKNEPLLGIAGKSSITHTMVTLGTTPHIDQAALLIQYAPPEWRRTLETLADLMEAEPTGSDVKKKLLLDQDIGRFTYFIDFWEQTKYPDEHSGQKDFYTWMPKVIARLKKFK